MLISCDWVPTTFHGRDKQAAGIWRGARTRIKSVLQARRKRERERERERGARGSKAETKISTDFVRAATGRGKRGWSGGSWTFTTDFRRFSRKAHANSFIVAFYRSDTITSVGLHDSRQSRGKIGNCCYIIGPWNRYQQTLHLGLLPLGFVRHTLYWKLDLKRHLRAVQLT